MRLIDADKLKECKFANDISYNAFRNLIDRQPTIEERKTGRWIECDHEKWIMGVHALRCSECNGGYHLSNEMTIYYWNYCPVCGAKMEVEHDS